MIIKDIQLINFGKFNHKAMPLEQGLNIIYGENEAGKTTLHTFIRGMLFGIEKQRGKASGRAHVARKSWLVRSYPVNVLYSGFPVSTLVTTHLKVPLYL